MRNRAIIAATDGTGVSTGAVEWAAREAHLRHLPLRIVHVYDRDPDEDRYDIGAEYHDVTRTLAEAVAAVAFERARAVAPRIELDAETLVGRPTARLVAESAGAELLVLGSSGRAGLRRLGSVSRRVTTHAACPVVVVPGDAAHEGPVVAGADDSENAGHVLETAFAEAAAHGCALAAVRSYQPVLPLWLANVRPDQIDTPEQDEAERTRLEELLAPWRGKFPDVPVEVVLTHESPAAALAGASAPARMVVVGSHGHGVLAGALLGSTGLHLLHHAKCPVYLVRPQPAGETRR